MNLGGLAPRQLGKQALHLGLHPLAVAMILYKQLTWLAIGIADIVLIIVAVFVGLEEEEGRGKLLFVHHRQINDIGIECLDVRVCLPASDGELSIGVLFPELPQQLMVDS